MKCRSCRKISVDLDTWWDRIRLWFFYRFKNDVFDLGNDKFTEGFGEGYQAGFKEAVKRDKDNQEMYKSLLI